MTKPTFRLRERPDKSTSCSHNKNAKIIQFNSNSKSFFSKKKKLQNASTEPECVNSAQVGVELLEMTSSTSDDPSIVQGINLLQGNTDVDKTDTNSNKESNETEGNIE